MRFGVCRGVESVKDVETAKKAGFDYMECGFSGLATCDENVFEAYKNALGENEILCEAANGFIPGSMKIIGPGSDRKSLKEHIANGMKRGSEIGLKTVVFGSGTARNIPEGMHFDDAFAGLCRFLSDTACPIASEYGIDIVIEPLRCDETNVIHTLAEGVLLAMEARAHNVYGLADLYHMLGSGEGNENIKVLKGFIKHAHISNPVSVNGAKRIYPADINEFDYKGFIGALEEAGCKRCSIEATTFDFETDAYKAASVLRSLGQ